MKDKEKNLGIEILRILCMLMIVIMHLLYKGNILTGETQSISVINQGWALEAFCFGAVNCYVMISGFLLVKSQKFHKGRILDLWIQTIFYSVGIGLLCFFVFEDIAGMLLLKSILPITSNSYWFITSYLILYLLYPILNKLILSLEQKQFRNLLIGGFTIFGVWQSITPFFETIDETNGYGFVWFVILYMTGAYFRLYPLQKKKTLPLLAGYVFLSVFTFIIRYVAIFLDDKIPFAGYYTESFYTYNSLLIYPASICLFLVFVQSEYKKGLLNRIAPIILFFSQVTVDVYLIHEQVILRTKLWTQILPVGTWNNEYFFIPSVIGTSLLVFIICSLFGNLRKLIFDYIKKQRARNGKGIL